MQRYKNHTLERKRRCLRKIHLLIFSRVIFNVYSTCSFLPKKILTPSKLIATCCGQIVCSMIKHVMLISNIVERFKVITAEKSYFNFYQITNNQLSTCATFQPLKMATILINNLFRGLIIYCAERELLLFRNSKSELYKFKSSINFMRKKQKKLVIIAQGCETEGKIKVHTFIT